MDLVARILEVGFDSEAGILVLLALLGALAIAIALPLAIMALGGAYGARRLRLEKGVRPPPLRALLWTTGVVWFGIVVSGLTGLVGWEGMQHGHPALVALAVGGAVVTLLLVGWWRSQVRGGP